MHWLKNYAFGSHIVAWLALPVIAALTVAVRIGGRNLFIWLINRKREADKGEMEYWRSHGEE